MALTVQMYKVHNHLTNEDIVIPRLVHQQKDKAWIIKIGQMRNHLSDLLFMHQRCLIIRTIPKPLDSSACIAQQ